MPVCVINWGFVCLCASWLLVVFHLAVDQEFGRVQRCHWCGRFLLPGRFIWCHVIMLKHPDASCRQAAACHEQLGTHAGMCFAKKQPMRSRFLSGLCCLLVRSSVLLSGGCVLGCAGVAPVVWIFILFCSHEAM